MGNNKTNYSWLDIICCLGLWMGISMFSVVQVLYYLLKTCVQGNALKSRRQTSNLSKNQDTIFFLWFVIYITTFPVNVFEVWEYSYLIICPLIKKTKMLINALLTYRKQLHHKYRNLSTWCLSWNSAVHLDFSWYTVNCAHLLQNHENMLVVVLILCNLEISVCRPCYFTKSLQQ